MSALQTFAAFVRRLSRPREVELLVMRLADMVFVHPEQITAHCSTCGHEVGVYPSGQRVLRDYPNVKLVCQVCREPGSARLAPGASIEPFQSIRKKS